MVTNCSTCAKDRPDPTEPLMSSSFPSRPWERLAADLFELAGKVYLIVVDYYSRWFEIRRLNDQSSSRVISVLKELFSTHGIPDIIVSDNGPQFSSDVFRLFTTEYDFIHVTSSPKYPRANGEFERAVRMKTRIQPSLLTDLHHCRLVFHPASCSWGAAYELKFLPFPTSSNLMCKIQTGKECN